MRNSVTFERNWSPDRASHPAAAERKVGVFRHLFGRLEAMLSASRQRRDLLTLDDRMLQDIGLSRGDVHREARRRFWDIDDLA